MEAFITTAPFMGHAAGAELQLNDVDAAPFIGKALVKKNATAQAEAIWAYLSLGPGLPLPEGIEPPTSLILTVKDRPVLIRAVMPETSTRSLAVGFATTSDVPGGPACSTVIGGGTPLNVGGGMVSSAHGVRSCAPGPRRRSRSRPRSRAPGSPIPSTTSW